MSLFKLFSLAALFSHTLADVVMTIPYGCNVSRAYTVTDFYWLNSTHNLNCIEYQPESDYYSAGCLDQLGNWCDPDDDDCTNCDIPYCNDDVPPQPLGFGPPDNVKVSFSEGTKCESSNSAGSRSLDIGDGFVQCGSLKDFLQFYGDSTSGHSTARLSVSPPPTTCINGSVFHPYYDAKFTINCEHDQGGNATCRATQTAIAVPFSSGYLGTR